MEFRPFSLSKAISENQAIQINKLKISALQGEMQRKKDLRQMAGESVVPTYGRTEGPPTPTGEEPQIQTGTEYSPELHQQKLAAAGESEMAGKIQEYYTKASKEERTKLEFETEQAGRMAFTADTPEKWLQEQKSGNIPQDQPFERREFAINMARTVKDLAGDGVKGGSSEFERLENRVMSGLASEAEISRHAIMAGQKARPSTAPYKVVDIEGKAEIFSSQTGKFNYSPDAKLTGAETRSLRTTKEKQVARYEKKTTSLRKEAVEGVEHFQKQRVAVNDAIAALESGNNALADTMVTQIMSQVVDSKVRAFQMYSVFDRSYGNIANRTFKALSQFVIGERTAEDRQIIKDTLLQFKQYSDPAANKMRNKYRAIAKEDGLDPFRVVPPDSPEDVRDAIGVSRDEKLRVLKRYFPEMFKK